MNEINMNKNSGKKHFDNFYFYTKTIENSRQLGYKDRGKLADRLLYDTLLSLGWDAKNLSIGSKLWKYAFGLNDNECQSNFLISIQSTKVYI